MPRSSEQTTNSPSNRSVVRAVAVLRTLGAAAAPMTATEVAQRIDLPRATAFRLLMTLEEQGFVDRQENTYTIGWDLARLAGGIDPAAGLLPRVSGILEEIAEEIGETITLSLMRGRYAMDLVAQVSPRMLGMTMSDMHGMRWPLHASATGKVLLAELDPEEIAAVAGQPLQSLTEHTITDVETLKTDLDLVRSRGWAITDEELEEGIVSVGVPIRDRNGGLLAAISFVGPVFRIDLEHRQEQTRLLLDGASRLTTHLLATTP